MVNSYSSFFQFWCKKSNFSPVVGSSRGLDPDPAGSKWVGSGSDPAGSDMSGSGMDPYPAV